MAEGVAGGAAVGVARGAAVDATVNMITQSGYERDGEEGGRSVGYAGGMKRG